MTETAKQIKHHFMAFRNGIVADSLRKAGMPYNVIFGLQLPQISEIACKFGQDMQLADEMWTDRFVRESRLLACYLFPPSDTDMEKAMALARDVQTREEADILCFRLLKRLPFADTLIMKLSEDPDPLVAYCGEALKRNLE